ncbi:MAG TPA: hypothetical protein VHE77_13850 [Dongiaceae bacterium]|jgi:hypothetical protein|nr:hypothetical protein [Dongiaceae bacterium]
MTVLFAGRCAGMRINIGVALALLAGLGAGLSGCGVPEVVPPLAIAAGVEGVSLNQTGKTASDHIASWVTGEDCSVLRSVKDGGKYCRSDAELAQADAKLHRPYLGDCYKTRGGVACYDQPDATHTSETSVYNAP